MSDFGENVCVALSIQKAIDCIGDAEGYWPGTLGPDDHYKTLASARHSLEDLRDNLYAWAKADVSRDIPD